MENTVRKRFSWVVALILALSLVLSTSIATYGFVKSKARQNTVTVTGSAKKQIKSDLIVWKGSFSAQSPDISTAYNKLKKDMEKVTKYLTDSGIQEKDMKVNPITTIENRVVLPNGMMSSAVESYRLNQEIEVRSSEVDKITDISRESTKLINDGVQFQSIPPQYFYTKIADLKVDMLALATEDARNRAQQIAEKSGTQLKKLSSAKMGVFQITPLYSNEISDYGINDTSSIEKEIMAVVNCVFETK